MIIYIIFDIGILTNSAIIRSYLDYYNYNEYYNQNFDQNWLIKIMYKHIILIYLYIIFINLMFFRNIDIIEIQRVVDERSFKIKSLIWFSCAVQNNVYGNKALCHRITFFVQRTIKFCKMYKTKSISNLWFLIHSKNLSEKKKKIYNSKSKLRYWRFCIILMV